MFSAQTKQIVEAFQLLEEIDPEWLEAIVNRPTGSQWGQKLNDWTDIANLLWQPLLITDRINGLHLPQCVYYHYLKNHDEEAWLIIGPQRGKDYPPEIVWTAYPGRIAICAPAHKLWDGTLDCLSAIARTKIPVAVKGIVI